jgi:hypothetical protein
MSLSRLVAGRADPLSFVMVKVTGILAVTIFAIVARLVPHQLFRALGPFEVLLVVMRVHISTFDVFQAVLAPFARRD